MSHVRDLPTERRQRNGHTIEFEGCMWLCIQCRHRFDALSEADAFWCGDDCACAP